MSENVNEPNPNEPSLIVQETLRAYGTSNGSFRRAHKDSNGFVNTSNVKPFTLQDREDETNSLLAPGATFSKGAGNRLIEEEPDLYRTCFERDLDRIKHSEAFRRLSGKCQVFLAPQDDMLRNRLTHAQEVAQVALSVAKATRLNSVLTEAIAIGHDCGHGPAGHASEDAFTPFLPVGYDHAVWGADVTLKPLNLTLEVSDGIRNHSWRRPAPMTPEGEVVSWADRIAYVCHDFDDAVRAGVITPELLPDIIKDTAGFKQSTQLRFFINEMVSNIEKTGFVGMSETASVVLDEFRKFNYEKIYFRPASQVQSQKAIKLLTGLVQYYCDAPGKLPRVIDGKAHMPLSDSPEAAVMAVEYISGMTDRYALRLGVNLLNWSSNDLFLGV